jgi:hypothetical protein
VAKIIFSDGGANLRQLDAIRNRPVGNPLEVGVVIDYSDGGQLYAYDKGVDVRWLDLQLVKVSDADDAFLRDFHATVVRGPLNTFTFTDEDGHEHTARWLDTRYPLQEIAKGVHAGTMRLRIEI